MTTINKNAIIPYSAQKMYELVLDINRYHEFLPWCSEAKVLSQTEDTIEGQLSIAHASFKKSFTTQNSLITNQRIEMRLLDGPFKSLNGVWEFTVLEENASKISLVMDFEFSNKIVSLALTPVFSQIANSMVDSFCKRAVEQYAN